MSKFRRLRDDDVPLFSAVQFAAMIDMGWLNWGPHGFEPSFSRAMSKQDDHWLDVIENGVRCLVATGKWKESWTAVNPGLVRESGPTV